MAKIIKKTNKQKAGTQKNSAKEKITSVKKADTKKTVKATGKQTDSKVSVKKNLKGKPSAKSTKKNAKVRMRYSLRDLQHFKNILLEEKKKIIESARANMMSLVDKESGDYVGDDLSYASHMAEQGTDEMEREKNYMFVQRDEKYLGYIEDALTRIDQGTYGICIDCMHEPKFLCKTCPLIPKDRLEIVPITQHCIECKNMRG